MTSPHILYTRPLALRFAGAPALTLTGNPPGYSSQQAYEGRLQIGNWKGDCVIISQEGELPAGASVEVDNVTHEVVIAWASFADGPTTAVPNGSFEEGDKRWTKGAGWAITNGVDDARLDGSWSAYYLGRGSSDIVSSMVPVADGGNVTASVGVQQGASSKNNVIAAIFIQWYDQEKKPITENFGNVISSGSGGEWKYSTVTAAVPVGAKYAALGINSQRRRQNKKLWIDKAVWNISYQPGESSSVDYFIKIVIQDLVSGMNAYWEGVIKEQVVNPVALSLMGKLVSCWEYGEDGGGFGGSNNIVRVDSHGPNHLDSTLNWSIEDPSVSSPPMGGRSAIIGGNSTARRAAADCVGLTDDGDFVGAFWLWRPDGTETGGYSTQFMHKGDFDGKGFVVSCLNGVGNFGSQQQGLQNHTNWAAGNQGVGPDVPSPTRWILVWARRTSGGKYIAVDLGPDVLTDTSTMASNATSPFALGSVDGYGNAIVPTYMGPAYFFKESLTAQERAYLFNSGNGITYAQLKAAAGL